MNEDEFWKIIDRAIEASNNDPDKKIEILREELEKLSSDEIISFGTYFDQKDADSYRWDLWAAAYTIHGGCSDDAFSDFRASLICLGKNAYEGALEFPDSLAKFDFDDPDESLFFEGYQYLPSEVYETKTGNDLPPSKINFPTDPQGEEWDEDSEEDLKGICPKLYAKYWA